MYTLPGPVRVVETQPSPPKHPVAKVSVEATTHMGGIFESNQAAPVYRNRLTEIQMFENNGSTGVQKSNAIVLTGKVLSAKAQNSGKVVFRIIVKFHYE